MRARLFAIAVGLVFVSFQPRIGAQCGTCIPGTTGYQPSGTLTYKFDSSFAGGLQDDFNTATGEWNSAFQAANSNIRFAHSASGAITVTITSDVCPAWGDARPQYNAIRICPDSLSSEGGNAFLQRLLRHELGHFAGLGASTCPKSDTVMTDIQPSQMSGAATTVGCADVNAIAQYYEPPSCNLQPPCGQDEFLGGDGCCYQQNGSPILVNLDGNRFELSCPQRGVAFDIFGTGQAVLVSWPIDPSKDAWLALDRNGDGHINSARELFGDATLLQDGSRAPNGFVALAEYDVNRDGEIDAADPVYDSLRLWTDTTRDGIASAHEMRSLAAHGILSIGTSFTPSGREDKYSNLFKYKSLVRASSPPRTRHAYDVWLAVTPLPSRSHQ